MASDPEASSGPRISSSHAYAISMSPAAFRVTTIGSNQYSCWQDAQPAEQGRFRVVSANHAPLQRSQRLPPRPIAPFDMINILPYKISSLEARTRLTVFVVLLLSSSSSIAAQVSIDCKIVGNSGAHDFVTVVFDDLNQASIQVNSRLVRRAPATIDGEGESFELLELSPARVVWTSRHYNKNRSMEFMFYITYTVDRRTGEYIITSDGQPYKGICVKSDTPRKF